jgi:hypothetical protein
LISETNFPKYERLGSDLCLPRSLFAEIARNGDGPRLWCASSLHPTGA